MGEKAAKERTDWASVWEDEDIARWDYLSQVIFNEMRSIAGDFKSKKIAELGSGSGRISKRMSKDGGQVTLVDLQKDVLCRSKKQFLDNKVSGNFIAGDLSNIPIKEGEFDIAWNAGVLEHFAGDQLKAAVREMARICKAGGLVITMNPYRGSILHNIGTRFLMKRSVYPFADEQPIRTLKDISSELGLELKKREYSSGFILLFVGMFKRLSLFPSARRASLRLFWAASDLMCLLDRSFIGPAIRFIDRILSNIFGGYLLISIFSPRTMHDRGA